MSAEGGAFVDSVISSSVPDESGTSLPTLTRSREWSLSAAEDGQEHFPRFEGRNGSLPIRA